MPGFLSKLFGRRQEPITIRARKAVIDSNVLNDSSRPIDIVAEEVVILDNKRALPWYQRPVGYVVLTVVATVIGGVILFGVLAVLAS